MEQERQVKGIWIPIEIWKDKNLTWNEKILFLEIDSYTSQDKDCFFSNEYISNLLGINETNANKVLSSLISKGYVVKTRFDGRHRFVKTALSYSTTLHCQEQQPCIGGNDNPSRTRDSNTYSANNNTDNKTNNKEKELKEKFFEFVAEYKRLTGKQTRNAETEFKDFTAKHKDWRDVVPLLSTAIKNETNARNDAGMKGEFFPLPKMLQTYLGKQRAWELYANNSDETQTSEEPTQQNVLVINGQIYR